jgi:hypothetical protein
MSYFYPDFTVVLLKLPLCCTVDVCTSTVPSLQVSFMDGAEIMFWSYECVTCHSIASRWIALTVHCIEVLAGICSFIWVKVVFEYNPVGLSVVSPLIFITCIAFIGYSSKTHGNQLPVTCQFTTTSQISHNDKCFFVFKIRIFTQIYWLYWLCQIVLT